MVPDGRTDGMDGRTDRRTHGRCQNYIPPTSSGDKNRTQTENILIMSFLIGVYTICLDLSVQNSKVFCKILNDKSL